MKQNFCQQQHDYAEKNPPLYSKWLELFKNSTTSLSLHSSLFPSSPSISLSLSTSFSLCLILTLQGSKNLSSNNRQGGSKRKALVAKVAVKLQF